jgi:hypothetical protein
LQVNICTTDKICKPGFLFCMTFLILVFGGGFYRMTSSEVFPQSLTSDEKLPEKGALCVLDEQEFEVNGKNSATLRIHRIFKMYNEFGKKYGSFTRHTNKFIKVDKIKAAVKDLNGKTINKLQEDDIKESALFPEYVLYSDDWVKYFDLPTTTYPYLLDYSCEVKYKSIFYWPSWFPQMDIPVENSIYKLEIPQNFAFKLYKHNLQIDPVETQRDGKRQLTFELRNLPAYKPEDEMPPMADWQMSVLFAPAEFDLDGYGGSTVSWALFGKWYKALASGQYQLASHQSQMIKEQVKDCISEKDTLKEMYQFLQRKTRYVAVHLGIGGYQPHDASSVLSNGYGDCKDLSTLFIAMLGTVGIKVYPALLGTRDEGTVLADFPSNQFNHVITFVPLDRDTFWLDCTCSYCPFGELPWSDEGCQALVVMDDTAALIETPTSLAEENKINRSIQAKLGPDGSMELTGTISTTGNFESYYRQLLNSLDAKEKKEWLDRVVGQYTPNHTLLNFDFENVSNPDIPFSVKFAAKLIQYPTKSGKDLLVNPNLLSRVDAEDIPQEKERKYPVDNQYPYTTQDEVTFEFPESLTISMVPEDRDIKSPYGSFLTRYKVDGNKLTYKRTKTITRRLVEPAEFEEYKEFLGRMYKADHAFVVLTNSSKP